MITDIRPVLRQAFSELSEQGIEDVASLVTVKTYADETHICHQGEVENLFYVIAEGEVNIQKQREVDGTRVHLATKRQGEFFGEMALIPNGSPRTADVITGTNCTLIEMNTETYLEIIRRAPRFSLELLKKVEGYHNNQQRMEKIQHIIFVSYSSHNKVIVKKVVRELNPRLQPHNVYLWLDQLDMPVGKDWDNVIEQTLYRASAMLLFISPQSAESLNVKSEWNMFLEEGKTVIPLLLEECVIPFRLRPLHYIDFTEHNDLDVYNETMDRLYRVLQEVGEQAANKKQ